MNRIKMIKSFLCVISFTCLFNITNATNIKGRIEIDNSWEPLIYLSVINSFDDLNTTSYDFLVARTTIDSSGYFEFNNIEIPVNDRMYRLHICKKGDPVSTIIMGGKNENFIHFIMKNGDSIQVEINQESPTFQHCIVHGHQANKGLRELFRLRKNLNSPPKLPSAQNRQFLRNKIYSDYAAIADTSSYKIIQLLAIYFINESFETLTQIDLMERIEAKTEVSDTTSPYYKAFLAQLAYYKYQAKAKSKTKNIWIISIALLILLLSLILNRLFFGKKSMKDAVLDHSNLISQLSVQEKRVLDLLKEGKSNKEISQELHIEVSTVKSHLNKIYSRLGVKSRKEIIHSDW